MTLNPSQSSHTGQETDAFTVAVQFARAAYDKKAENIVVLDLRGRSQVTDVFVIATADNPRQRQAVTQAVIEAGREVGARLLGSEGQGDARWVLLDFVDVIVHVFDAEWRDLYDLELLWGDAPRVSWEEEPSKT